MADDNEPTASVFELVAELEREHYTRREIHDALRTVADNMKPNGGFAR